MTSKVFEFNEGVVKEYMGDVNAFFEERRLNDFREVEMGNQQPDPKTQKTVENKSANQNQDKQLRNKISKLEEEISIKEFDIKKLEEKIEKLSEEGKYEAAIVEQLGAEKKTLERLLQEWEKLQA